MPDTRQGIMDAIRKYSPVDFETSSMELADFDAMCEKIFAYSGSTMFIYKGIYWRASPVMISDGDSSGPWRDPTEKEIASLPKLLRKND